MTGHAILAAIAAIAGLVVGPLLRVAVDQVPPRRPVLRRRSDVDGPPLHGADLAPLRSWWRPAPAGTVVPMGSPDDHGDGERPTRVRRWRAPVIDLATAAAFAALAARAGWSPHLPAFLVFGAALAVVTVIDLDHYRIPDRVVFPAVSACGLLLVVAAVVEGVTGALVGAGLGAVAYFAFLFLFFLVSPSGMGFGDVKLALLLGLVLGWSGAVVEAEGVLTERSTVDALRLVLMGGLFGSILGSVAGLVAMATRGRRAHFPFGPALCLGALVAVLFSETILG